MGNPGGRPHVFVTVQLSSHTNAGPVAFWASGSCCWREALSCETFQKGLVLLLRGGV